MQRERLRQNESVLIVAETGARQLIGFCQLYPMFCSVRAAPTYTAAQALYESLGWVRDEAFFVYGKSFPG